jgi:hypothetical protein
VHIATSENRWTDNEISLE